MQPFEIMCLNMTSLFTRLPGLSMPCLPDSCANTDMGNQG